MTTIKIDLDDDVARAIEESARREHKSVAQWVKEQAERAGILAAMEARALANGYPPNWLGLYGSLADDERFVAPTRGGKRCVAGLDVD